MSMINAPAPWPGTTAEAEANRLTHRFVGIDGRCEDCDCRAFGVVATWPCGANPPRVDMTVEAYAAASAGPNPIAAYLGGAQ